MYALCVAVQTNHNSLKVQLQVYDLHCSADCSDARRTCRPVSHIDESRMHTVGGRARTPATLLFLSIKV
jgi:hypothetical protein